MAPANSRSDDGNINIDFLVGLLVFILAFSYVMTAIPGIFIPYQSTSIDLGSVVYRTSSILVEDPGWFTYTDPVNVTSFSFSNWEQGNFQDNVTRVGLAIDKRSPNVLSMDKIRAMEGLPYIKARDKMGLNNTAMYNFSLTLFKLGSDSPLLNFSSEYQTSIVESIDRIVHIREGQGILIEDASTYADPVNDTLFGTQNFLIINYNPSLSDNVSVRIQGLTDIPADSLYNITVSFYYDDAHDVSSWGHFNMSADYSNNDYYIYKNGRFVYDIENTEYKATDVIDIVIDADRIFDTYFLPSMNLSTVRIDTKSTSSCFPRECIQYESTSPYYKYFDTDGIMTLRVWRI